MAEVLVADEAGIAAAVAALRRGDVVGMPTETVYGLAADALNTLAVESIFAAKGRPADNPLIVHGVGLDDIERVVARFTPLGTALAERFWPGPLTLVFDAAPGVPLVTTGGLATVAVRVPDHPVASALIAAFGGPVAAPSANRSGRPSPTRASHVVDEFGANVSIVLDGGVCSFGLESTVVDVRGAQPTVLREGSITREDLADAMDIPSAAWSQQPTAASPSHLSPGTRYRHYVPDCAVELVPAGTGPAHAAKLRDEGSRVGLIATTAAPEGVVEVAQFADAAALAQQLYAAMRAAEAANLAVLVVECVPEVGVGRAVMDRLRRAAA